MVNWKQRGNFSPVDINPICLEVFRDFEIALYIESSTAMQGWVYP